MMLAAAELSMGTTQCCVASLASPPHLPPLFMREELLFLILRSRAENPCPLGMEHFEAKY
jgi:hypothetical protein